MTTPIGGSARRRLRASINSLRVPGRMPWRTQGWLDACAHAAQALGQPGGAILQALLMQLLPTIQGQCFLAGEEWQVFPTLNECRYTIAFDAGCQRFIAEAPLFALARVCQPWRGAFKDERAKARC